VQKVDVNITCQTLQENVRTNQLVTNDTTPHHTTPRVYGKAMLVVALLENVPLQTRRQMYYQHDGAPPQLSGRKAVSES